MRFPQIFNVWVRMGGAVGIGVCVEVLAVASCLMTNLTSCYSPRCCFCYWPYIKTTILLLAETENGHWPSPD